MKLFKPLNNNRGGANILILGIFVFLFLMTILATLFQNYALFSTVYATQDSMQKTALTILSRQTETTYASKRESNHGAYTPTGSDWLESIQSVDAVAQLNTMVKATRQGDTLIRYGSDHTVLYRLKNIRFTIENPKIHQQQTLKATLSLLLEVPVRFGSLQSVIDLPISVTAENKTKY